jgi:hypothetical protein
MSLQLWDKSNFIPELTPATNVLNLFNTYSLSSQSADSAPITNGREQQQVSRRRRSRREPHQFALEAMIAIFCFTIRL